MSIRKSKLANLPFAKELVLVANAYAWKGNRKFVSEFAAWSDWHRRIIRKTIPPLIMSLLIGFFGKTTQDTRISTLVLEIFPSLLGFGIGVFALLFIFPPRFHKDMESLGKKSGFSIQIFPADMAYPLVILTISILIAFISNLFNAGITTQVIEGFLFIYGLLMTLELIGVLFMAAIKIIGDPVNSSNTPDE
ncbi:MAG: hypothetical protein H6980_10590 [Gammaproteobacteria bacterium]|nr:hypothetical protein [Gammaproteobacteria bacterium]